MIPINIDYVILG